MNPKTEHAISVIVAIAIISALVIGMIAFMRAVDKSCARSQAFEAQKVYTIKTIDGTEFTGLKRDLTYWGRFITTNGEPVEFNSKNISWTTWTTNK